MLNQFKRFIKKKIVKVRQQNANQSARLQQIKNVFGLSFIVLFTMGFYLYNSAEPKKAIEIEAPKFDGALDAGFNHGSDEALLEKQQQQIDELKKLVSETEKETKNKPTVDDETKAIFKAMEDKLANLEKANQTTNEKLQIALLQNRQSTSPGLKDSPPTRQELEARRLKKIKAEQEIYSRAGLETVNFRNRAKIEEERTSKNYVWAGTFAEGVLLTGILGDAGINGSKNMGTAMIRLTSRGIMPNDQQSNLEGCFALVSTYGDLSGSSVVLHLETLSCAGHALNFEQQVYGSVFDLDAMQDLRGTAVLKTKPLLSYSAAAGLLAGIGDGLKNYGSAQSINSNGSITTFSTSSIAQSAAGGALSNPANRISDYVMKIADIYHPLVVAKAGRRVSVLFTKGFWTDRAHQKFEAKSLEEQQEKNASQITTTISRPGAASNSGESVIESPQNLQSVSNTPAVEENTPAIEQQFLAQNGVINEQPMFSAVQNAGDSHE